MKKVFLICVLIFCFCSPIGFVKANAGFEIFYSNYSQIQSLIEEIYSDNFEQVKNRTAGGAGELAFANILSEKLDLLGLQFLTTNESYLQEFQISETKSSQNVIGLKDNGSQNYVILGAHYDAVYKETSFGYNDNLSGVVGALYLVEKLLNEDIDSNIIVVFYGAEEAGCLGSKYFVNHLPDEIKNNILLSINYDSIGGGEHLYYFHTDYPTVYGTTLDNFAENSDFNIIKPGFNRFFSSLVNNDLNYTSIVLNSDNSTYLKNGINSLMFFAGDLNATNGLGFFEKAGHSRIMHNTDSEQTNLDVFGESFYENIDNAVLLSYDLLISDDFNEENFFAGQVNPALYSDFVLKIVGVIFIVILLAGFFVTVNLVYKKQK